METPHTLFESEHDPIDQDQGQAYGAETFEERAASVGRQTVLTRSGLRNRTPVSPADVRDRGRHRRLRILASVTALVAGAGVWANSQVDKPGEVQILHALAGGPVQEDNKVVIVTTNEQDKLGKNLGTLAKTATKYHVDVFMIQEANGNDLRKMHRDQEFSHANIYSVLADPRTHFQEGGYYDAMVLMGNQKLSNVYGTSFAGNTLSQQIARGIHYGILNFDSVSARIKNLSDATQENRAAIEGDMQFETSEGEDIVRLGTFHTGGDYEVHERQFNSTTKAIIDRKQNGVDEVACGDTNADYDEVVQAYTPAGFHVYSTAPTTTGEGGHTPKEIDDCMQLTGPGTSLRIGDIEVLENDEDLDGDGETADDFLDADHKRVVLQLIAR